jgi:conjugal transfer/type IV secretion protein DotA/TraY
MKYILILATFLFTITLSGQAFSEENRSAKDIIFNTGDSEDCGLIETTDNGGGFVINPNDASICQQDVVGNSLYFIFGKVIEEVDILKSLLKTSDGVKETALGLGIGDPIVSLLGTITTLVLMVGMVIITLSTVAGMLKSTGGEFLNQKWDTGKVIARVGGSIMLMFPIAGGLSLIQISVLLCALIANIGGNYITANFLNLIQVKSTQIETNEENLISLATGQTNNLISGELCLKRTSQKLLENNFSVINETDGLKGYLKTDIKVKDTFYRYENCMTPANIIEIEKIGGYSQNTNNSSYISLFARGNIDSCRDGSEGEAFYDLDYDEVMYGAKYTCAYTAYNYNDLEKLDETDAESAVLNSVSYFRNKFKNFDEYKKVVGLEGDIKKILDKNGDISFLGPEGNDSGSEIYDLYAPIVKSLKEKIVKSMDEGIGSNSDLQNNPNMRYDAIYIYHQYVLNNLMGAFFKEEIRETRGGTIIANTIKTERTDEINSFAHTIINDFALPAADFLEKSHCAKNWELMKSSRNTVREMKDGLETLTKDYDKKIAFECVNIDMIDDAVNLSYNTIESEYMNSDQNAENGGDPELEKEAKKYHEKQISPMAENEARVKQQALILWFYIARKAVLTSLTEEIKSATDELTPAGLRQQGWGGLGGYMLSISGNQKNANKMYQGLTSGVTWGNSIGQGAVSYVSPKAFELLNKPEESIAYKDNFKKINNDTFFNTSGKRVLNSMGVYEGVESFEAEGMQKLIYILEKMLTTPMVYIEQASGIDRDETDLSFRAAIKQCSKAGDCKIGDTHPLNALMQFGHELVTITTTMMIAELVLTKLASVMDGDGGGTIGMKFMAILGAFGTALAYLVKIAAIVLQVLSPITMSLLFVGILFAYIVPTIPYVAFTIVLINWIILVIELMIILPIWITMFSVTNEDGSGKTDIKMLWNFYGQLLLKPAFVVIALIVGWGISTVSLYIINMTAFSSYVGSSLNNSSVTGIVDVIMFYVVYIILAFIAIKQSFTVINSLPDTIFSRINIQSTGDSQMIGELGVERMLQASAMQDVLGNLQTGVKSQLEKKTVFERNNELEEMVARQKQDFANQSKALDEANKPPEPDAGKKK